MYGLRLGRLALQLSEGFVFKLRHSDLQVDAIEQRTRDAALVALDLIWCSPTARFGTDPPGWTRVHCSNHLKFARIADLVAGPGYYRSAAF